MGLHPQLSVFTFLVIVFLPAAVALVFAWGVWMAGKRPAIAPWRISAFNWALGCALADTVIFLPNSFRFLTTEAPATGIWFAANCTGLALLILVLGASLVGKGWSRGLLLCWGVLLFLGVFVVYTRVP
jgi:hypothetical protein